MVLFLILKIKLEFNGYLTAYSEKSKIMANLQGTPKKITQMATVCTGNQFEAMCKEDPTLLNGEYVYLSVTQVRNELCGGVIKGALPENSVAIIPQDCSAGYLSFLLNSMPVQYILFEGKYNSKNKTKINRKLVSSLIIYDVEQSSQDAYELADSIREITYGKYMKDRENMGYHRLYYMMTDLCNMLALELYAHPMFEEKGIFILESWKEAAKEAAGVDNPNPLFDALLKSDKRLRNELMKAHMLIDDITKYLKSKTDGVED